MTPSALPQRVMVRSVCGGYRGAAGVGTAGGALCYWDARRARISSKGRWRVDGTPVAHGEFSIVIAGLAVSVGIEYSAGPLATAYVVILVVLGSLTARYTEPVAT